MFRTKKDVDKQVRSMLSKIREDEKPLRGYKIALMYFKIGEYDSASEYLKRYILVDDKHPAAHKLLGQCYEKLKRPDKQLEAYQRSLELDKKQSDLLIEVCKLMQNNELSDVTPAKARYWYEMAESRNIHDAAVLNLKLKFSHPGDNVAVQDIILKEIVRRPFDSGLRIRLIQHYMDQKRIDDAFKYVYDLEVKSIAKFRNSSEWYATVTQVLEKYRDTYSASIHKNWPYWLMLITVLERQLFLALSQTPKDLNSINQNFAMASALLFEFDQNLNTAATSCSFPDAERDLASEFLAHFRGQFCLHAASLLFKRESQTTRDTWLETTKLALPLLLLAFNCGSVNKNQQWLKTAASEATVQLVDAWHSQSNFRLSQAGRTLQSCISAPNTAGHAVLANLRKIGMDKYSLWSNKDDLLNEIRSTVVDTDWRKRIYRNLFKNKDYSDAVAGSHFLRSRALETPTFDWPDSDALSILEENAQSAEPASLAHIVYLTLARTNGSWREKTITINPDSRCILFGKLSFSIQNLSNCGAESLNQLDIDSFVYAATIQAKRKLTVENSMLGNATTPNDSHKPKLLPFANMTNDLCTEDQSDWFEAAFKVYNNASGDDLATIRATLQHGIEAVRGVGSPKMDLIILLKLGQLFSKRAQNSTKAIERSFFEDRSEALFKFSLQMLRMQNSSRSNEPYRRLFKYATGSSYFEIDSEVNALAEEAITFLAGRYFRNNAFEECVEDFAGIKLPFGTYFQAESYRKMTEFSNTPKKNKRAFLDKARDCLKQTLDLLDGPNVDKNHPLKSIVDEDIKRLQSESRKLETNQTLTDSFVSANGRSDLDDSNDRVDREAEVVTPVPQANYDNLERLIRQVIESLAILKDDVNEKMSEINERLQDIEDNMSKEQDDIPSIDEEDYYYGNDQTRPNANDTSMMVNVSRNTAQTPKQRPGSSNQQQQQQQQQQQSRSQMVPPPPSSHQSPMVGMNNSFNPMYAGFYGQMPFNPYQAGNMASMNQVLPFNEVMNYNNLQQQLLAQQLAADNRNASLLGFLQQSPQVHPTVPTQVALPLAVNSPLSAFDTTLVQQPLTSITAPQSMSFNQTASKGITTTPTIPAGQKPWNSSMNNQPVEKSIPVNVVITNSDRLPSTNVTTSSTVSFSVTIPPQHIKNNPAVSAMTGAAIKNPSIVAALQDKTIAPQSNATVNFTTQSTATAPTSQEQKSMFGTISKPLSSTPFGSPSTSLSTSVSTTLKPAEKSQTEAFKSPFAGFSFAQPTTKMESPFSKLNPIESSTPTDSPKLSDTNVSTTVADASKEDDIENYEPTAHFEPVIPLPDLVEVKTGEENETILFEHRAKLLRYVKESKEWRERGIGNIKLMANKDDPNKVRLLMRREQVLKLCCNQLLSKDTKFSKMPNTETALSWFGQDYSENELQVEMLAIRFKTADLCKQFHAAVLSAQEKMTNATTATKSLNRGPLLSNPVQSKTDTKSDVKGFGDQFKAKAGSWNCEACYISNKETDKNCVACATPKDKNAPTTTEQNKATAAAPSFIFGNSGAGFTPKPASTTSSVFGNLSLTTTNTNKPSPVVPATNTTAPTKGFGDQFKPKPGSWSCKACYTSNTGENLYCLACEEPKDDTVPKKGGQNAFGTAMASAAAPKPTFSFGNLGGATVTPQTTNSANPSAFGSSTFSFSLGSQSAAQSKPVAESNLPQLDSKEFSFVFKSKSPAKTQANISTGLEDVSDDENVEEEENNTYFTPVIPLPDKIEVKSGEEDEDVLYTHRAKLYRFRDKEWRERGLGDIKILRHKQTGKLRVVMRREQIQKICLNHVLVPEIEYKVKESKSWQFVVSDFSDGVLETDTFCIRFKTDEIAREFKQAIDGALNGTLEPIQQNGDIGEAQSETESLTAEERQTLADLKLPNDFFKYKKQDQCTGCRGCNSDDFVFAEVKDTNFGQFDDNPLPLVMPPRKADNDLSKTNQNRPFSMQPNTSNVAPLTGSIFGANSFKTISAFGSGGDTNKSTFAFGHINNSFGSGDASKPTFSFVQTNNSFGTEAKPTAFGQTTAASHFGTPSIFGGNPNGTDAKPPTSGFSFTLGSSATENNSSPATPAPEAQTTSTPIFGEKATLSFADLASKATPPPANNTSTLAGFSFASLAKSVDDPKTDSPLFASGGSSFADLAKSSTNSLNSNNNTPTTGGFFGLSNKHTFNNLMQPSLNGSANNSNRKDDTAGNDNENTAEDPNYDPHYEPIIALPDEIQVSTGEEEEQKLFGERAKLFRFDATNKEWKERGVGEIKILYHPVNKSYRLLLRREQIHKLVLNMAITGEFQMNPMKQSDKAFCWVAQNYAEDQQNGELESLSVRFKNANLADNFNTAIQNGIAQLKARGDLEPQDD